jgi:hypothetical protein
MLAILSTLKLRYNTGLVLGGGESWHCHFGQEKGKVRCFVSDFGKIKDYKKPYYTILIGKKNTEDLISMQCSHEKSDS